jgi:hypothetical protein
MERANPLANRSCLGSFGTILSVTHSNFSHHALSRASALVCCRPLLKVVEAMTAANTAALPAAAGLVTKRCKKSSHACPLFHCKASGISQTRAPAIRIHVMMRSPDRTEGFSHRQKEHSKWEGRRGTSHQPISGLLGLFGAVVGEHASEMLPRDLLVSASGPAALTRALYWRTLNTASLK